MNPNILQVELKILHYSYYELKAKLQLFMMLMPFTFRAIGGEVSTDGDFLIFESNRYNRKGFLFKSFAMSAIVSTCTDRSEFYETILFKGFY